MKTAAATPVDVLFRALSDRTRLRILLLLGNGELCVCHLVDALLVPQPTASRHLGYLRRAGLVTARKEGQWSYYRLARPRGAVHAQLLKCVERCAEDLPETREDARRLRSGRGCC